jgi:hypothetical protein
MGEKERLALRKQCQRSLFDYCLAISGYDDITEELHGELCLFLQKPGANKQVTLPRSFVKTWICSIAMPQWLALPRTQEDEFPYTKAWEDKFWTLGPNIRILIASYVISNAEKMIGLTRKTYESNSALQILFPEVIPVNFNKTRWSNESACINRPDNFTESTFEAAGIGGASISRHYDCIIEDDLVYAKKDDLTGKELQPGQEDIDKAIGWHKLSHSLLVPGKHTRIYNIGTRWAKHDLIDYIWKNEPSYTIFHRGCVDMKELETRKDWRLCTPVWKEAYDIPQLQKIYDAQGSWMFSTQYLTLPISPEECLFKREWLQEYTSNEEVPKTCRIFTTVDLAEWTDPVRKSDCDAVVITCGWDDLHNLWILHYDKGRFDPSKIIKLLAMHWEKFHPEAIGIESVYYQKSLAHFAREYMFEGKVPMMTIRQLKPEAGASKELRIRALEPLASNLAIHCKSSHRDLMDEFVDYVPNSRVCKKDILDALAYQLQIARPGQPIPQDRKREEAALTITSMDNVLEGIFSRNRITDRFGNKGLELQPYVDKTENPDYLSSYSQYADPYFGLGEGNPYF